MRRAGVKAGAQPHPERSAGAGLDAGAQSITLRAFQGGSSNRRGPGAGRAIPCTDAGGLPAGEEAQGGARAPPRPRQGGAATPPPGAQRSAQPPGGVEGEQRAAQPRLPVPRTGATAGEAARVPGVPGPAWPEARRGDRLRCRRRGSHRGRLLVRLGRGLGLLALANTRGDGLFDGRRAAWGGPLWSGFYRMGGVQGLEAFDKVAHRGQRPLGILVRRAGQRGLELGAERPSGPPDRRHGQILPPAGLHSPAAGPERSPDRVSPCRAPQPRCRSAVRPR